MRSVMTTWNSGSKFVGGIQVSAQDNRLYKAFVLPNQLQVLLVSDPSTEKSAAALAVQVGHQSDPHNLPGLAHFCEHMLFLGTQKYPEETSYKTYLSAHGGRSNASTSAIATNYYFDVATPHLFGALDRFAQFFIAPLFTESATEREMHAIDAENAKNLMDDSRRMYQLMKSLANPAHPFHKFGTGNLDTLGVRPKALGIDVRAELLAFHKKHYSANAMKLVIYGKDDLNILEDWAIQLFSPIENKDVNPYLSGNAHPYETQQQGRYINVLPVKDLRTLELSFPLPSMQSLYLEKPNRVLSHLLGHEGSGSLCAHLKALGVATGVSAGLTRDYRDWSQFSVKISLTPKGLLEVPNVLNACFQYLHILNQTDAATMQKYFDEARKINSFQFQYQNKQAPINFVSYLTRNLQLYPVHHVASGPYIFKNYVDANLRQVLAQLTPDRLRL
ncbi:insulin-degrading-like enzyme, metalloprotease family M16A, partial [Thraustotheca clavata]